MKKPSTLIRVLSIVLCVLLCLSMMAGILIASVRLATTKENTAKIIRQALFASHMTHARRSSSGVSGRAVMPRLSAVKLDSEDSSGMMTGVLVDWLYESLTQQYGDQLPVTKEAVEAFIEESTLKDEIADLAGSLISDFITGENTTVLDEETVTRLLRENAELIETHFGLTLTEDAISQISTAIAENDYVAQLQEDGIGSLLLDAAGGNTVQNGSDAPVIPGNSDSEDSSGGSTAVTNPVAQLLNTFRAATSIGVMIACFAVAAVCIAVLCILNRKWIWYAIRKIGIGLLVGSLPALIPTVLAAVLAGLWNSLFTDLKMVGTVVQMILKITAPICISAFVIGLALIILASVLKSRAKKLAAEVPAEAVETVEEPAAQIGETEAAEAGEETRIPDVTEAPEVSETPESVEDPESV